ncbi:MAG: hypothetical protein NZ772_13345 [Cyanobacteria bacterium]|nr:hypothetical protein [Cyanobacteriota bacterium]MDW8202376.1 hypothetical protein [Cyanobacteriota bacterium SKYGB_h_bin112]
MNVKHLAIAGLGVLGIVTPVATTAAPQSQTIQVAQMPETRPPIAVVNPNKPIRIRVINNAKVDIVTVLLQPASSERYARPKETVTFGVAHTQFLPVPINLVIYTNDADAHINSGITVIDNEIIVTVVSTLATTGPSRVVNVATNGAVYKD